MIGDACPVFRFVEQLSYELKVLIVVAILVLIGSLLYRKCRLKSRAGVLAILAAAYYGIFIVIRYFSSMDSFYFRFFEPASFLLCPSPRPTTAPLSRTSKVKVLSWSGPDSSAMR